MTKWHIFRVHEVAPQVVFIALLSLLACSEGGPGAPLTDERYPAKGQSIAVNPPLAEMLTTGERIQLSAEVRDALGTYVRNPRVTWESLDPSVATVDQSGGVTGVSEGVAEIRGTYAGVSATAVVSVSRPQNHKESGESVTIYPDADTVASVGGTEKLLAIGRNRGGQLVGGNRLSWATADEGVATVDGDGYVTGRKSGKTSVVVYNGSAADTAEVWVAPSDVVVALVVTPAADTIRSIGGTLQLKATAYNGSSLEVAGRDIGWKSLDATVATVSNGGEVLGVKKGVARIVAFHKELSDTATVWVEPVVSATSLYVTPKADTIPQIGGFLTLTATLLDGSGEEVALAVTWSTLDPTIASVAQVGEVKGLKSGVARITATSGALVDTARIWVAPTPPAESEYVVDVNPAVESVDVDGTADLQAVVATVQGATVDTALATWASLDPEIADVSEPGPVRGISVHGARAGNARIVATYGVAADTALVTVADPTTGGSSGYTTVIRPDPATIDGPGQMVQVAWSIWDSTGKEVTGFKPAWVSLDPSIVTLASNDTPVVKLAGVATGSAKVVASWNGMSDTVSVTVNGATGTGGAKASVQITPSTDSIANVGGQTSLSVAVRDTLGNAVSSSQVTWGSNDPAVATVDNAGLVTGTAKGLARITATWSNAADTAWVWVAPGSKPPAGTQLTPAALLPTLGPLVARGTVGQTPFTGYDYRYEQTEQDRYATFLKQVASGNGWLDPNHYGGLRSRLMWAIRNGEPYGPGATSTSFAYGRGRHIVLRYLEYSKRNAYKTSAHHNTGLADAEALYVLEGNLDALNHIHVTAMSVTTDRYDYLKMLNVNSDARQITVGLQALMAAHRLGIPYVRNPANTSMHFDESMGSWKAVGERQILWLDQYGAVKADGSIPSPAHNNHEAYLFNAWLATALLQWCANIEWHGRAFELARLIMDHLISELKPGWETLGYLDSSTAPGWDLAAFYIWPSLVLWQETGDAKYYDFAMQNMEATRKAYIDAIKQFNQTYSTMGQGAEALVSGVPWR